MTEDTEQWNIQYSEKAKSDLRGIFLYIKDVLLEPEIAANLYRDIVASVRSLETMPYRFHLYREEPWNRQGVRVLQVKNYLAFYKPDEETHMVRIVRILYAGRDLANQLKEIQNSKKFNNKQKVTVRSSGFLF